MQVRPDSILGRAALAARHRPAVLTVSVPPRLARFLVAAGAQPAPVRCDTGHPTFLPFAPARIDEAAVQREFDSLLALLIQNKADESSLMALDGVIREWESQWVADVNERFIVWGEEMFVEALLRKLDLSAYEADVVAARGAASDTLEREIAARHAFADRLKHAARSELAAQLRDPSPASTAAEAHETDTLQAGAASRAKRAPTQADPARGLLSSQ